LSARRKTSLQRKSEDWRLNPVASEPNAMRNAANANDVSANDEKKKRSWSEESWRRRREQIGRRPLWRFCRRS
jgi:hypothetical protein